MILGRMRNGVSSASANIYVSTKNRKVETIKAKKRKDTKRRKGAALDDGGDCGYIHHSDRMFGSPFVRSGWAAMGN